MNELKMQQAGGFPLETDTLDFMQTAYDVFNALGELAGNLAIVSGCEAVGSQINSGKVYINGKLLAFRGGAVGTNVVIRQEITKRKFEDGNEKDVYKTRYACFGTGVTMYTWADFKRIKNLQKLQKETVPIGAIIMWAGAINAIPAGWKLCDGTNGTPNLLNRFIVGAGNTYDAGSVGGLSHVKLKDSECALIRHEHYAFVNNDAKSAETAGYLTVNDYVSDVGPNYTMKRVKKERMVKTFIGKTSATGTSSAANSHENRPPYYALAFIQFIGH